MQPQHRIEEMIVDLSFSTTRLARCEKNKLADWLSDELLPSLDKLFSHYVPGDQILRLDQLEFDLGNVASHNYQQVIAERLIAALTQILEQQLLATAPQFSAPQFLGSPLVVQHTATSQIFSAPAVTEESRAQGNKLALQQLFSYLNSGQIRAHRINTLPHKATSSPVHSVSTDSDSETVTGSLKQPTLKMELTGIHEQLLAQVLGEQDIAALLRELPQRQALVQRLTKQFSEQHRMELLRQLAPRQIQMVLALLDWLHVVQTSATHSSNYNNFHSNNIATNNVHNVLENVRVIPWEVLWEELLDIALSQPTINEIAWLRLLLEKLAARLTISERELFAFFPVKKIEQMDSNNSTSDTLTHLVESLNRILKNPSLTSNPAPSPSITAIPINNTSVSDPLVSIAEASLTSQTTPELTTQVTSEQSLVATNNIDSDREQVSEKNSIPESYSIAGENSVISSDGNAQMPIAYQQIRLSAANAAKLNRAGDQQLFELCLDLKSGSLLWAQLSGNAELLERLIKSYIRLGQSVAAEHTADFLSAITTHAPLSQHKASYYLQVLQHLLANELIDLEAIVDGFDKQTNQVVVQTKINEKEAPDPFISHDQQKKPSHTPAFTTIGATHSAPESTIPKIVPSETINRETVSSEGSVLERIAPERLAPKEDILENSIPEDSGIESEIDPSMDRDELANALLTGNRILASLQLNIPEWQLLVAAILRKKFFISAATTNHFISAVQYALTDSTQPTVGYRALIARLMTIETLDAEAIIAALKLQTRHLTWNRLSTAADFLPRIVRSYINFFPSLFRAGYADLVDPIEAQAAAMGNNIQFYQQLLNLLFNAMAFDADTFDCLLTNDNLERGIQGLLKNTINKTSPSDVSNNLVNTSENPGLFGSDQNSHDAFSMVDAEVADPRLDGMEPSSSKPVHFGHLLEELATALLAGKIFPSRLELPHSQWQQLVAVMIKQKYSASATDINSLLSILIDPLFAAGADQSTLVNNYRATIARIISMDVLDIEAIIPAMNLQMRLLSWEMVPENPEFLWRTLRGYIEFSGKLSAENSRTLITALDAQTTVAINSTFIYRQLLNQLFSDVALDIEAFCDQLAPQVAEHSTLPERISYGTSNADADKAEIGNGDNTSPAENIPELVQQLLAGKFSLRVLELSTDDWPQLIASLMQFKYSSPADEIQTFSATIEHNAKASADQSEFYRQVLSRLLNDSMLDLEEIHHSLTAQKNTNISATPIPVNIKPAAEVSGFNSESSSNQSNNLSSDTASVLLGVQQNTGDKSYTEIPIAQSNALSDFYASDNNQQPLLNKSSVDTSKVSKSKVSKFNVGKSRIDKPNLDKLDSPATNSVPHFVVLADALVTNDVSLTDLVAKTSAFSDTDWSQLLGCIFQTTQTAVMAPELQQAIAQFATQARNRPHYYMQIVAALMAERSIDLEAFAALDNAPAVVDYSVQVSRFGETASTVIDDAEKNHAEQNRQQEKQYPVQQHEPQTMTYQQDQREANVAAADLSRDAVPQSHIQPNTPAAEAAHNPIENPTHGPSPFITDNKDVPPGKIVLAQLLAQENPEREQLLILQQQLNMLLHKSSAPLTAEWLQVLTKPEFCARLIRLVPGHLLHQLCNHLLPQLFIPLEQIVKLVSDALNLLMPQIDQLRFKQVKWEFIFQQLFAGGTPVSDRVQLTQECCLQLAARVGFDDVESLIRLAQRRLVLLKPPAQLKPTMNLKDLGLDATVTDANKSEDWAAGLSINNAGQVLVAPYLPRLFSMLNLTQEGKFIHLGAADRAAHLVQFIVTGQMETPEYELPLNKIVCGISTSFPLSAGILVTEQEHTLIEQMLTSMIQHWKVLGSTSIAGLRETFFQRQGWLVLEEDCWRLKVQERSFDMLLDRLPWSIALIKHGWMDKPLRVSWRNHS